MPLRPRARFRSACAAVALAAAMPMGALAQPADARIALPAGTLEDALNGFARRAGITLSFDPALVRGRTTPALSLPATPADGLAALLAPHGLQATHSAAGGYLLRPAPIAQGSLLPTVTVTAEAERADGPVTGYVARRSATANRIDTALVETPRAVSVVSRNQIEDQAAQSVAQSLRYTAGVLTEVTGYDASYPAITVRGFAPAEFLDGFRLFVAGGYSGWLVEPQGLERVELLKGPSSALYGYGAPGGVLNLVSKRPSAEAVREVGLALGSHGRVQGSFDFGGKLDTDGRFTYRLNGVLRDSGGQTDFSRDDRTFLAPALTWKPTADTTLTLLADITRDRVTPKSWWPDQALLQRGRMSPRRFVGEPGFDRYDRDTASLAYLLDHRLNERWVFRQKARYSDFKLDYRQLRGTAFRADLRTLERQALRSQARGQAVVFDNALEGQLRLGDWSHTLLFGVDYQRYQGSEQQGAAAGPPLDAFAPVYGAPVAAPRLSSRNDALEMAGISVQDQMRAGPWTLDLALRHDRGIARYYDARSVQRFSQGRTTYSLGLLYRAANGLSPYINHSTSFMPVMGANFNAAPFRVDTARQFELGLKYQPPGSSALFTLSAFELYRHNLLMGQAENYLNLEVVPGRVRSRGLEIEAGFSPTPRTRVMASYTYLDARVLESVEPGQVGRQPMQTARHTASLWLDHRFGGGWSLGAGLRYVGRVPASIDNRFFNPSYTVVDAALRYDRGPWSYSLNAVNLFDRTYVSNLGQVFGQGRTLQARAVYRW